MAFWTSASASAVFPWRRRARLCCQCEAPARVRASSRFDELGRTDSYASIALAYWPIPWRIWPRVIRAASPGSESGQVSTV